MFFFFFCKKKFPIYFGGGCQFKINSYKTYFICFCRRRNSYVHHVAVLLTSLANEAIGYSRNLTIYIYFLKLILYVSYVELYYFPVFLSPRFYFRNTVCTYCSYLFLHFQFDLYVIISIILT